MELARKLKFIPKFGGNRELPENEQGIVVMTEMSPGDLIAFQALQEKSLAGEEESVKASLEIIDIAERYIVAVTNFKKNGQPVGSVSEFIKVVPNKLFWEIMGFAANPVDEDELKK